MPCSCPHSGSAGQEPGCSQAPGARTLQAAGLCTAPGCEPALHSGVCLKCDVACSVRYILQILTSNAAFSQTNEQALFVIKCSVYHFFPANEALVLEGSPAVRSCWEG